MDDPLRELFRALFVYVYSHLKGRVPFEEMARLIGLVLDELRAQWQPITWDQAKRRTVPQLKRRSALFKPSRVVAFVTEVREPQLVLMKRTNNKIEEIETTCARIQSADQQSIWLLDVVGPYLLEKLDRAYRNGGPVEFLGVPIALPVELDPKRPDAGLMLNHRAFFFHIVDMQESCSCLDLIAATDSERHRAADELWRMQDEGRDPMTVLRDMVLEGLRVVAIDDFPLLRELIEFSVLQALSAGTIGHASARLHMLLVGPPAQGKKLIGLAARVLNPLSSELSAAKVTPAGLVGASYPTANGWSSRPGALARAAHGVAVIQDAHGWTASELAKVGPILQEVIEDGVVRDTSAGGVVRSAPVGMIIDLNRTSQLGVNQAGRANEAAILRLRPLLSRVDLIAEIPSDPDRAWAVAASMYERLSTADSGPLDLQPWVREARLLVAALRDRHPVIDLKPATTQMKTIHEQIWAANRSRFGALPEAADIPTRLTISFARLVAASARGADRSFATDEDVARAWPFLVKKLEFLRLHCADGRASGCPDGADGRREWVWRNAQTPVRPDDLAKRYQKETGDFVSEKTMRRDLAELGANKVAKGKYLLPPPQSV